jgi:hypothetical protein
MDESEDVWDGVEREPPPLRWWDWPLLLLGAVGFGLLVPLIWS